MSIAVENLSKRFGSCLAVDQLSFSVEEGEVLGFLGPNGAGKSTTMKMLTGFLEPSEGSVQICDWDITKQAVQAKSIIGYLPEGAPVYGEMSVREFLKFVTKIRRLNSTDAKKGFDNVVEKLELHKVLLQSIETLSKGFKRRVGLAQAMIHDPKVLIMDEPTDGLDPNQKHQVRQLITSLTKDKIVIISTHILEEVSAVCSRAMIIAEGCLLIDETPANLLERSRYHNGVSLQIKEGDEDIVQQLEQLPEVEAVERHLTGNIIVVSKGRQPLYPKISRMAKEKQWNISNIQSEYGKLDEVFRTITQGSMA